MSLTLTEANRAIDAALVKADELEITISVSVCDAAGRLAAHQRQRDEASLGLLARQFRTNVVIGEGAPVVIGPGGLPLMRSSELEGAIGVSGAPDNEQNAECAKAGVEAFGNASDVTQG